MRRSTAKMIKLTAKATQTPYRRLKKAFYRLSQKEKHLARQEMRQAFYKKESDGKETQES